MRVLHLEGEAMNRQDVIDAIDHSTARLATLGGWPSPIRNGSALRVRVPTEQGKAPGFDAGIACALDLIPRDRQRLSAILHGGYTEEAVAQIWAEIGQMYPDSETCWWFAARSATRQKGVSEAEFEDQIDAFRILSKRPGDLRSIAISVLKDMQSQVSAVNGVPFITQIGDIQCAYVSGYSWGVTWYPASALFRVETFKQSLGLEDFPFFNVVGDIRRQRSGLVLGSPQVAEVGDIGELGRVVEVVRAHLG